MGKIISSTPSREAISALRAIPFENIIGGPLRACVNAQRIAAQTTMEFIQKVGLEDVPVRNPDGSILKRPRIDQFGAVVRDDSGKILEDIVTEKKAVYVCFQFIQNGRLVRLNVPMLSIVPIPYIAINTIDISFKANIKAQASVREDDSESEMEASRRSSYASSQNNSSRFSGGFGFLSIHGGRASTRDYSSSSMQASISSKKDSRGTQESKYSVEYTMDVAVHASQDSMPAGMAKVLELIGNAMDVCAPEGEFMINNNRFWISGDQTDVPFEAAYRTPEGLITTAKEAFALYTADKDGKKTATTDLLTSRSKDRATAKLKKGVYLLVTADGTLEEVIKVEEPTSALSEGKPSKSK